ncbi:hypothetical protein SORBI_3008G019350 [Sorghum bicolor]|uniref:H15 domain-containing protein n=1 Tax=Sorghum bicolor TaxID=4558 RepID=A0A1Z5R4F0_SORBI|nr:hypothetical protein SORBI_3008G019350 [Sorghum bicolor]
MAAIEGLSDKNGLNKSAISKNMEGKYGELPLPHVSLLTGHLERTKEPMELIFLKNNYFDADAPDTPLMHVRGCLNMPLPPPKLLCGCPPKAKNLLDSTVKQATTRMPKACGRPPKKAQTTNEGEPQPWPPSPPCTTLTPISDGSAIKARNTNDQPAS